MLSDRGNISVKDPVCGEVLDVAKVQASEIHKGWAYFFCSSRCHERFSKSPSSFMHSYRKPTAT